MLSSVSVCLLTGLQKNNDQILMSDIIHPGTNRLDFGGNLDLDPDPGTGNYISKEFYQCDIGNYKCSSCCVQQQFQNTQASGPQIEQIIKVALGRFALTECF